MMCATGFFHWRATGANNLRHCWISPTVNSSGAKARHCYFASGAVSSKLEFTALGKSFVEGASK